MPIRTPQYQKLVQVCLPPGNETKTKAAPSLDSQGQTEVLLLAELANHLTPREYFVVISLSSDMSVREIAKRLCTAESTVRKLERAAQEKMKQPWRFERLRRKSGLGYRTAHETDPIQNWISVSPTLLGILRKRGVTSIKDLISASPDWFSRFNLNPTTELELHRLLAWSRSVLKK